MEINFNKLFKPHKMLKQNPFMLRLAVLLLLITAGCKKKESATEPVKPVTPTQPVSPENPKSEVKTYIPLILQTDNEKIEFKYADDGVQLTEIKYATGTREVISYKDKKPREYRRYLKEELIYTVDYILNAEGLVITANRYQVESGGKLLTPLGNYQISYNEHKMISAINWFDFRNNRIKNQQYSYDENQLLIGIATIDQNQVNLKYSYDSKSGLLKNTTVNQLFAIENDDFFLRNTKSNLSIVVNGSNAARDVNIISDYNTDGYPSAFNVTDASKKTVYKITYR